MPNFKITIASDDGEGLKADYAVTAPTVQRAFLTAAAANTNTDEVLSKTIRDDMFARQVTSTGTVVCPSCSGFGEFQESYAVKGTAARIIDCPDCLGRRFVASELAVVLQRRGAPTLPEGWVA